MARKEITLSQYWFLAKKIIANKHSDNTTFYVEGNDNVTGVEYFTSGVKISIHRRTHKELTVEIKTFRDSKTSDEVTGIIPLPLLHEFSIHFWIWKYTCFVVKKAWIKDNKNKVNENIRKINELITIGFPEDVEKELLK